jgi:hypothetical protein
MARPRRAKPQKDEDWKQLFSEVEDAQRKGVSEDPDPERYKKLTKSTGGG